MTSLEPEFVLARLAMLGVNVDVEDGRLRLSGMKTPPPEDLRAAFLQARDGIVELLRAQGGSMRPVDGSSAACEVLCLSCYGTTFVRLRNGRRSVCPQCERVEPSDIAGLDSGCPGGPLERDGGAP